jgi:glutathione S-transferase
MSLVFYGAPMSTASITEAVLAELDVPHERRMLEIGPHGTQSAEFLKVNPNGRVPAIVHDGTALWESAAITLYLGECFGVERGLFPAPGAGRGRAMSWVVWSNVALAEAGSRLASAMPQGGDGGVQPDSIDHSEEDAAAEARARADIGKLLGVLEGGLGSQDFLLGGYSLVDTHVSSIVGWLAMMAVSVEPYPAIAAWMGRCWSRPALARMMGQG